MKFLNIINNNFYLCLGIIIALLLFIVLAVNCYFEEWMKNEWGLGAPTFMLFISSFAILGIIYFFIKEIWDNR